MLLFDKKHLLISYLETFIKDFKTIGFVPTMGALHNGHLSLLQESIQNNDLTVCSIFVNPTQFNNPVDLEHYPRTLDSDILKIKSISDKIIVFAPKVEEIYGSNPVSKSFDYDGLEHQMEGKQRFGHFDGVGTIVKVLFEIIKPTTAYFGEKDFQQLQIVKKMVQKLKIPVKIVGCPIFREANGLAMSSRNERLTNLERQNAKIIYQSLQNAKSSIIEKSTFLNVVFETLAKEIEAIPDFKLEYFEIADEETLLPLAAMDYKRKVRLFIAVSVRDIRLIDNISV